MIAIVVVVITIVVGSDNYSGVVITIVVVVITVVVGSDNCSGGKGNCSGSIDK